MFILGSTTTTRGHHTPQSNTSLHRQSEALHRRDVHTPPLPSPTQKKSNFMTSMTTLPCFSEHLISYLWHLKRKQNLHLTLSSCKTQPGSGCTLSQVTRRPWRQVNNPAVTSSIHWFVPSRLAKAARAGDSVSYSCVWFKLNRLSGFMTFKMSLYHLCLKAKREAAALCVTQLLSFHFISIYQEQAFCNWFVTINE